MLWIHIGFKADPDPAFYINEPMTKNRKILVRKKFIFIYIKTHYI